MNFTYPGICSSASENGMFMCSFIKISINLSNWLSNLLFLNLCGYGAKGFSLTKDSSLPLSLVCLELNSSTTF